MSDEEKAYYEQQLQDAAEYQDFLTDELLKYGISLNQYSSKKYQYDVGESASGIEVKHDKQMDSGNVFIEVAEKRKASMLDFTPSGIYRDDTSYLYLVGDYEKAFLFSKAQLRTYVERDAELNREQGIIGPIIIKKKTSKGFLFPIEYCKKFLCIKHFEFGGEPS